MARIIIVGGGFAGIETAQKIAKGIKRRKLEGKYTISIIDRHTHHTFTPALIPATTTPKTYTDQEIRNAVCIPFSDIKFDIPIEFICDEIDRFDITWNSVVGTKKHYEYDYLVITLGQDPTFFDIQGMKSHALTLTGIDDVFTIRNEIERQIHVHDAGSFHTVIIGGGPTGVEFASFLASRAKKIMAAQTGRVEFQVSIIEKGKTILQMFSKMIQKRATRLLDKKNISIFTEANISFVSNSQIEFENREKISYNILIWGGGKKAHQSIEKLPFIHERGSTISVSATGIPKSTDKLEMSRPIYIAGDSSFFSPTTAWIARNAIKSGNIVASQILSKIDFAERLPNIQTEKKFTPNNGSIIMTSQKGGILSSIPILPLYFGLAGRRFADLKYLLKILPLSHAFEQWKKMKILYK